MDFVIDREHQLLRKMYREFAENEVKPIAAEIDEEERFPEETIKKMAKLGMMGLYFPKEYGGAGADILAYAMAVEEMAKVCTTTSVALSAHVSLCTAPIFENGTEEQKKKYLPKLCSGEWLGAFGLTEPGAGTDAQGQQTVAVLDESGENWILNGSKIFITNAGYADVFIIIAVTGTIINKRGKKEKEISAFVVERTDPGFSVGKHEKKMGIRGSSTCELIMEDCVIPKDRMLGKKGKGFQLAMKTLDGGRIGIAAQALGIAEGAIEETVSIPRSVCSSVSVSPSSRTPSSSWLTCRPERRLRSIWFMLLPARSRTMSLILWMLLWPSCLQRRRPVMLPVAACSCSAATATP